MKSLSEAEVLNILGTKWRPDQHPFLGAEIGLCTFPKIFPCLVDFEGAYFSGPVDFTQTTFKEGVSFVGTIFHDVADFTQSSFEGPAFFWRCRFEKSFLFEHCKIREVIHKESPRYPGETNFSYTRFEEKASFKRTHFDGPSIFHRTCFLQEANFEECRFLKPARFDGSKSDICLSEAELPGKDFIQAVEKASIIYRSEDHPPHVGCLGFYNLDPEIGDDQGLRRKMGFPLQQKLTFGGGTEVILKRPSRKVYHPKDFPPVQPGGMLTEDHWSVMETLRSKYFVPMFSTIPDARAVFVRTQFSSGTLFSEVNLEQGSFQQTSLEGVIFASVRWAKRPLAFRGERAALYDEAPIVGRALLEDTYHDLRMGYQKRGVIDVARDFYFGEMELKYMDQGHVWKRIGSLAFLYRYLSGFGRQQGLAGCWLVLFTLFFFPVLFAFVIWLEPVTLDTLPIVATRLHALFGHHTWTGAINIGLKALFRSLEACTFIARNQDKYPALEKLIAGLERLVVFSQLTLFLLATKWQFERNPGSS